MFRKFVLLLCVAGCAAWAAETFAAEAAEPSAAEPLRMVVMDPLAAPLSCPCVEGYAQRKYEVLATHLEAKLGGREVVLVFGESLALAQKKLAAGQPHLIIGKDSVVRADAQKAGLSVAATARLTDKKGSTMQHGLIVVPAKSPAQAAADLNGYQIIFGPADCTEKHQAAIALLKSAGVAIPAKLQIDQACSDGACKVVELGASAKAAAVISSYAEPLLEGCGTIKKGDLRVVAKTAPVPFITAFASDALSATEQQQLQAALLSVIEKPETCAALESLIGFVAVEKQQPAGASTAKKK
jgi:ABC-type phosphate/phosphonate transport system substrate-binding protein